MIGLLLVLLPISGLSMDLRKLDAYPGAQCLDGTPGAYYIEKSSKAGNKRWQLFFEGGGWCYNDKDCANRALGQLGSSSDYPSTIGRQGGVASPDCDINPTFCEYNSVYLKYCDGNSFSGALDGSVTVKETGQELFFRGSYILDAILEDLVENEGMDEVEELNLSGCSAGGLSTFLHSDHVRDKVQQLVGRPLSKYGSTPVSGFFLMNRQNVHDEFVMAEQIKTIFSLSNATHGVHRACIEGTTDAEKKWLCNTAPEVMKYMDSPIFVLDSSFDSWQSGCIMMNKAVDYDNTPTKDMPNGNCGSADGWEECAVAPENCGAEEIYGVVEYQGSFIRLLTGTQGYQNDHSGAFIYECFTHCAAAGDEYASIAINGVLMKDAVNLWWDSLGVSSTKSFLPKLYGLDSTNPNSSCQ
ncbi:hypothetical protein TrCOL_g9356 [Triparma columacea]|uniref:Pectin acetylesterase n=1 Tax=Triparma columacea TaxID=722753 RepID=A0A9W7LC98_9STRA|nr:hypothetical protein TrCOL_g9356 [Triparma columacea]